MAKSWKEVLLSKETTNVDAMAEEALESMESVLLQKDAIFLTKESSGGLSFLHHLSKVETKDKTTIYVALAGIGSHATPVELDPTDCLVAKYPWQLPKSNTDDPQPKDSPMAYTVRQIQLVPSNLRPALLESEDHQSPSALLLQATQALQGNRSRKYSAICQSVIAYITCVAQNGPSNLKGLQIRSSTTPEVLEWSTKLHKEHSLEQERSAPKDDKSGAQKSNGGGKKQRSWDESFVRLVAYHQFHGDCNVPREFKTDPALGEWVKNQRAIQKTLSTERRSKLESLGFTFSNTQQDRSNKIWESYFEKLEKVMGTNNNNKRDSKRLLLSKPETREDKALQHWVSVQRQNYKRGVMPEDRRKRLDAIGFVWKLKNDYKPRNPKDDSAWQKGYDKLVEFHKIHSHVNVPKRPKSNRPLWEWVYAQKKAYNEQRLPREKVQLMEKLGMVWQRDNGQAIRDQQWDAKYKECVAFRELHGHLEVPRAGKHGNTNLLKWLGRQREQYRNEKLAASRIQLLRDLSFDFDGNLEQRDKLLEKLAWKEAYGELVAYQKANGTVNIPEKGGPEEKRLEKWIAKQKVAHQFKDLDPVRMKLLVDLGVDFDCQTTTTNASKSESASEQVVACDQEEEPSNLRDMPKLTGGGTQEEGGSSRKIERGRKRRAQESPGPGTKEAETKKIKTSAAASKSFAAGLGVTAMTT